ncbi:MAG: hypothetical protein JXM73_24685 [Anaerolineae bacterium]|nr:hypothetical protein [Anaerolineae bacterium]
MKPQLNCIDPGAIQAWELDAYADGQNLPHVAAHLAQCPACRARLEADRAFEARVQDALYRFDCPSPDLLRAYSWGDLPAGQQKQLQGHLAQCPRCADELAEITKALYPADTRRSVDESVGWRASASTLLARAGQAAAQAGVAIAQLVSRLSSGPPAPRLVPVWRGQAGETLLFEADEVAVSINLEQDRTGAYALSGQVLSASADLLPQDYARLTGYEGANALQPADAAYSAAEAKIDINGVFIFPNLRPGAYQLVLSLADRRIVIPSLVLEGAQ